MKKVMGKLGRTGADKTCVAWRQYHAVNPTRNQRANYPSGPAYANVAYAPFKGRIYSSILFLDSRDYVFMPLDVSCGSIYRLPVNMHRVILRLDRRILPSIYSLRSRDQVGVVADIGSFLSSPAKAGDLSRRYAAIKNNLMLRTQIRILFYFFLAEKD